MIFHIVDVSVPHFERVACFIFHRLIPSFVLQGFMNGMDYFFRLRRSQENDT
jgi:hypothetical protein